MIAGSSSIFLKCIWNMSCFMSRTFKMLISNWSRTRKFNWLLHLHAGKAVAFDFSHCHALITLYVQFLCLIGQILTGEFMRKIYAVSGNLLTDSWSWQSFVREVCVMLWCFKLFFLLGVQNEIQLLLRFVWYSLLVYLLDFWWRIASLVKVIGNPISDGIIFQLAWCVRGC